MSTFCTRKVDAIRAATADKPMPPPEAGAVKCSLSTLRLLSQAEVRALITTSPIKSCVFNTVPTFLLCTFVDTLLVIIIITLGSLGKEVPIIIIICFKSYENSLTPVKVMLIKYE